jgi:hypothetical protein
VTTPATHAFAFSGELLQRGFWLYVWEIQPRGGTTIYYVGRTGDSSSLNAQSPFNRMGQHLGFNIKSNVLRRRLKESGIAPEICEFRLVAHGPILAEAESLEEHRRTRDVVAALEKALAEAMSAAGYEVINRVDCRMVLDDDLFAKVRAAFAPHFPQLRGMTVP